MENAHVGDADCRSTVEMSCYEPQDKSKDGRQSGVATRHTCGREMCGQRTCGLATGNAVSSNVSGVGLKSCRNSPGLPGATVNDW